MEFVKAAVYLIIRIRSTSVTFFSSSRSLKSLDNKNMKNNKTYEFSNIIYSQRVNQCFHLSLYNKIRIAERNCWEFEICYRRKVGLNNDPRGVRFVSDEERHHQQ